MRFPSVSLQIWKSYFRPSFRKGLAQTRISAIRRRVNFSNRICSLIFEPGTVRRHSRMKDVSSSLAFPSGKTSTCMASFLPLSSIVPLRSLSSIFSGTSPIFLLPPLFFLALRKDRPFELEFVACFVALERRSNNWEEMLGNVLGDFYLEIRRDGFSCLFLIIFFFFHFLINEVGFKKGEVDISASQKNIKDHN